MTNLDSLLKSRDITLPTKARLVKAIVSPVDHIFFAGGEGWEVLQKSLQMVTEATKLKDACSLEGKL